MADQIRSRAMSFYDSIPIPDDLTAAGIDAAFLETVARILRGHLSRTGFADVAYHSANLLALPIGHLLDHRVRSSLMPPLDDGLGVALHGDDWDASLPVVEEWLAHMLEASDRTGARRLVADALRLDPASDARMVIMLGRRDRTFYRHCVRGRLGTALRRISSSGWTDEDRRTAARLIANLLVYFSCLSIQLVAARGWWIDHLPIRDDQGTGPYRVAALTRDLKNAAEAIDAIADYATRTTPRYPNRAVVTDRMDQARTWRARFAQSDDELRTVLRRFYEEIQPVVRDAARALAKRHRVAARKNVTVHRAFYGVTAGEALAFGVTRLVQLRRDAQGIVDTLLVGNGFGLPETSSWPKRDDPDVASILYVYRIALLRDAGASLGKAIGETDGTELSDDSVDLATLRHAHTHGGTEPGQDLIDEMRAKHGSIAFRRLPLTAAPLIGGQRFDVLPEYWLQQVGAKVGTTPRMLRLPLKLKKQRDEKDRNNRPPNVWRASGKDRSRSRRRPK